jgi:NAD/NADP transhydrogenase beta subunit
MTAKIADSAGPVRVTEDTADPIYNAPYIDVNELRNELVRHRYMHDGFKGTDARFSFYFPPSEQCE